MKRLFLLGAIFSCLPLCGASESPSLSSADESFASQAGKFKAYVEGMKFPLVILELYNLIPQGSVATAKGKLTADLKDQAIQRFEKLDGLADETYKTAKTNHEVLCKLAADGKRSYAEKFGTKFCWDIIEVASKERIAYRSRLLKQILHMTVAAGELATQELNALFTSAATAATPDK